MDDRGNEKLVKLRITNLEVRRIGFDLKI